MGGLRELFVKIINQLTASLVLRGFIYTQVVGLLILLSGVIPIESQWQSNGHCQQAAKVFVLLPLVDITEQLA